MNDPIVNRVAQNTSLINLELKVFGSDKKRLEIDIKKWLHKGLVLKEKPFRKSLKEHDWSSYKDMLVCINCSSDVIIPTWAYMLVSVYLEEYADFVCVGSLNQLEINLFNHNIFQLDSSIYKDKRILIKGCSETYIPESAYVSILKQLMPVAKSVMFGEACSNVPVFKKR